MRLILVLLLSLVLVTMLVKPLLKQEKAFLLFPSIFAILIVILGVGEARWLYLENVGTALVKEVSGKPEAELKCQRTSEAIFDARVSHAGYVSSDNPLVANVVYNSCQELYSWLASDRRSSTDKQKHAVITLIHEAYHVSGDYNETSTECKTKAYLETFVTKYANAEEALAFTSFYETSVYPNLPQEYRATPCEVVP